MGNRDLEYQHVHVYIQYTTASLQLYCSQTLLERHYNTFKHSECNWEFVKGVLHYKTCVCEGCVEL